MACGKPCVATKAGDSAEIVGDCGSVVAMRDPPALARAILGEIEGRTGSKSDAARQRVIDNFSTAAMAGETLRALFTIVNERR